MPATRYPATVNDCEAGPVGVATALFLGTHLTGSEFCSRRLRAGTVQ